MQKTDLIKASEKPEHIRKHRGNAHVIGSKALKHVSEQNIHDILSRFEQAYALMIDERENPGRQEFCLKTSAPVGTDAVSYTHLTPSSTRKILKTARLSRLSATLARPMRERSK